MEQEPTERARTDASLRTERKNADEALAEKRSADQAADKVVQRARSRADEVLDQARGKADVRLDAVDTAVGALHDVVARERAREDAVLQRERDAADQRVRREREEQAALLEGLLLKERSKTDRYLMSERTRSDDAIANRDDFLGMVSHDLRNLLNSISLNAQLLAAGASMSEEGKKTVTGMERVQRDTQLMDRLIGDLVDVVRIDAGKLAIHLEDDDATAFLRDAVDSYLAAAAEKGIALTIATGEAQLAARFDRQRMLQVLGNCLSNAIKFTPRGGRVVARCERVGDDLSFSIQDTGPGIPENMHEAVFERFWQVGKNDQRGLGLGLYISRCIVEGHGGRIWIESSGAGSTFHCTLPLAG